MDAFYYSEECKDKRSKARRNLDLVIEVLGEMQSLDNQRYLSTGEILEIHSALFALYRITTKSR